MRRLALTGIVVASLAVAGSAQAAQTTVKPAIVKAGARATLTGGGFPKNRVGVLVVGGRTVAAVRANARGKVKVRFAARGRGQKSAVLRIGGKRVVNAVRVAKRSKSSVSTATSAGQRVLSKPAVGRAGAMVKVQGAGFAAGGLVRVLVAGAETGSATASARGAFKASFRMPPVPTGKRPLVVRSARPAVKVPFRVRGCGARVCLPYELDFDRNHGGLRASGRMGTGFTTFASTKNGGGYNRQKLAVGAGLLKITTASGIAFGGNNSQENMLAVGVNAASQVVRIETTVTDVPAGTGAFQQGGLWFGSDQNNYVKLHVASVLSMGLPVTEIRLELEVKGQQASLSKRVETPTDVTLHLQVDNNVRRLSAGYSVDGGPLTNIRDLRLPNDFFGKAMRAGIHATHRNGPAPLVYNFDDFSVTRVGRASAPAPPAGIGQWATRAPAPRVILDAGGAAVGGKLYVVAGKFCCDTRQKRLFVYDPATNSWSAGPNLPDDYPAVEDPAAVGHGGKLYVFGGGTSTFTGAVPNAAVFDPVSGMWTSLAPMPTGRSGAKALANDGKIYVTGGLDSSGASVKSVDVYDLATGDWSSGVDMSTARSHHGAAVLGGKLYVFGGRTRLADGSGPGILRASERFDPVAGSWEPIEDMLSGRRSPVVGTLQGCAQVMGGEQKGGFPGAFFENEQYDPASDTWTRLAGLPTARHGAAAATIGSAVYVAAGGPTNGSSFTDVNEAFTLPAGAC